MAELGLIKTPVIFTCKSLLLSKLRLYLTRDSVGVTAAEGSVKVDAIGVKLRGEGDAGSVAALALSDGCSQGHSEFMLG